MKKRHLILIAALMFLGLPAILLLAETQGTNPQIHTYPEAIWYAFTTLTTVGYGDLVPVTTVGKCIGFLLMLLSVGVLAFFVSLIYSLITGTAYPRLQLFWYRKRNWYVFLNEGSRSNLLADKILREDQNAVILFTRSSTENGGISENSPVHFKSIHVNKTPQEFAELHKSGKLRFFQMNGIPDQAAAFPSDLYCCSDEFSGYSGTNVHLFNINECLARSFWNNLPLLRKDTCFLLIGSGRKAEALLEWGLMRNCVDAAQSMQYHLFGNYENFINNHQGLSQCFAIGTLKSDTDSLFFHTERWNQDKALLERADYILFCDDQDEENRRAVTDLKKYFVPKGQIYVCHSHSLPDIKTIGSAETIYTPELVIRESLDAAARKLHEKYLQETKEGTPWEELSDFLRRSNVAAADHLPVKASLLLNQNITTLTSDLSQKAYQVYKNTSPEGRERYLQLEHQRWMRFHIINGWEYAPVRCNELRQHPMICPYEELSRADKDKDGFGFEMLGNL